MRSSRRCPVLLIPLIVLGLAGLPAGAACLDPNVVSTFAGRVGQAGFVDGPATSARFSDLRGAAVDAAGNLYVTDSADKWQGANTSAVIRKITPAGVVSTIAGDPHAAAGLVDGQGRAARFSKGAHGLAVDAAGNIYVADSTAVRKVTPAGVVTTVAGSETWGYADGPAQTAVFRFIRDIALDSAGAIYVSDEPGKIRKIEGGMVTLLAGSPHEMGTANGLGSAARFGYPGGMTVSAAGDLYVADQLSNAIRRIDRAGAVTTVAGRPGTIGSVDGNGPAARFFWPNRLTRDAAGTLYIVERGSKVRQLDDVTGRAVVTTVAGSGENVHLDGTGNAAGLMSLTEGIAYSTDARGQGFLYVVEAGSHTIRKVSCAQSTSGFDGSFEIPALDRWAAQYSPAGSNWKFSRFAGIQAQGSGLFPAAAIDGVQTAVLRLFSAQIEQTINVAAGRYAVSFHAGNRVDEDMYPQSLLVMFDGVPVGPAVTPVTGKFGFYTTPFVDLTAGPHTLAFQVSEGGGPNSWTFIDLVKVTKEARGAPYGLTFALSNKGGLLRGVQLSCHGQPSTLDNPHAGSCNPYKGDTTCQAALPIACYKPSTRGVFPQIAPRTQLAATQPVVGASLGSAQAGSARCEAELGRGWRMAEFHDGGGWQIDSGGGAGLAQDTRYWVHINNQAGNCWGR